MDGEHEEADERVSEEDSDGEEEDNEEDVELLGQGVRGGSRERKGEI